MKQSQNGSARRMRNYKKSPNHTSNGSGVNRVYDSNGPEGRLRGTPMQIYEKYVSFAKDAKVSGDNVKAERCLQHADHYSRIAFDAINARQNNNRTNNHNQQTKKYNNHSLQNKDSQIVKNEEKKTSQL